VTGKTVSFHVQGIHRVVGLADQENAIESIQLLKAEAKDVRGYGYAIDWREINSRKHGRNLFPAKIVFETENDFLRYIGKQREFSSFISAVERTRARYPVLQTWIRSHRKLLIDSSAEVDGFPQAFVDGLLAETLCGSTRVRSMK
jgi:hypothetical protein